MENNEKNHNAYAYIHLDNLKNNLKVIRAKIKKKVKILIPVKSNAYGFGIIPVSKFLEKQNIDYLGVAYVFEGIQLRKNKIKTPILIFSDPVQSTDYEKIIHYKLTPTVYTIKSLKAFNRIGKKVRIHINVDTGMGRLGISMTDIFDFLNTIQTMKNIILEGIYTHLSSSTDTNRQFTLNQLKQFDRIITHMKLNNYPVTFIHALNSGGILNYPEYCYNMVRPGIMFYGYYPDNKIRPHIKIKPGMDLKIKIIQIKKTSVKTPVSYNHTYYTKQNEIIATIGSGYGDGISRLFSNKGYVLYKDKQCPIRGNICMDQFMIDISSSNNIKMGDFITLFGRDNKKKFNLENFSAKINTIPYEILCQLSNRIKRIYRG